MKKVTLDTYRKEKYYPRVVKAVARILLRSDVVAPVEVLIEMGNLSRKNHDDWRSGQVSYLERVFEGSLSKAGRILRIIGFHVHDLNMIPIQATYQAGSGKHRQMIKKVVNIKNLAERRILPIWKRLGRSKIEPDKKSFVDSLRAARMHRMRPGNQKHGKARFGRIRRNPFLS